MAAPEPATPVKDLAGQRPTRVRYQVLAVACSLAVVTYIHRLGLATADPYLKQDLGLSRADMGYIQAAFAVAYGLFEVPCGVLGDRLGVRHLLVILVLGWSLTTGCEALVVLLPAVWILQFSYLLLVRFLFGMFQAGVFPSLSRMTADWLPIQERASAQGLIWMSSRLGGATVPHLLVPMIVALQTWETPLWIVAGLGLFWCAGFWPWFRNRPEEMKRVNPAERRLIETGRVSTMVGHGNIPWARILHSRNVWAICLVYGFGGFAANFYVTYLPTYLRDLRGLSPDQTKWMQSLPLVCGIVGCVLGGFFSDWLIRRTGNRKWGRRLNGTVGMTFGGLGWLALAWVQEPLALAAVLCLIFFCNDVAMGPAWAACADIGRRFAGTIGGAMNMIGNLAGAMGNILAGILFERQQVALVFIIYAVSFGLSSLCWQGVDVTKPLQSET